MIESGIGGQIRGVSLDSFLQMAQMEKTTCTLKIVSGRRTGLLYVLRGELISAEAGDLTNIEAAYQIIAWENVAIEIQNDCERTENEIRQPLMNILMEGLRRKDELRARGLLEEETPMEAPPDESAAEMSDFKDLSRPAEKIRPSDRKTVKHAEPAMPEAAAPQKSKWLVFGGLILLLLCAGAFLVRHFSGNNNAREYAALMAELDNETDLTEHIRRLKAFVEGRRPDEFTAQAGERVKKLQALHEETQFDRMKAEIAALPVDDAYETKARSLYETFLSRFPKGLYAPTVRAEMAALPEFVDDYDFAKIQAAAPKTFGEKIQIFNAYLEKHPDGKHRETVEEIISSMGDAYHAHLQQQIPLCDKARQWEPCIDLCNGFINSFKEDPRLEKVVSLKIKLKAKQDLNALTAEVEALGDDYTAARRRLQAYIADHPDSIHRSHLESEIRRLEDRIAEQNAWRRVQAYGRDTGHAIENRLKQVQEFLEKHSDAPNAKAARVLLSDLQAEQQSIRLRQKKEALESLAAAKVESEREKQRKDALRRRRLEQEMTAKLSAGGGRYRPGDDGIVYDRRTGLTWTLLDSSAVLGKCIDYRQAASYVERLTTGGYTDWRLPTGAELAGIYKNEPFYPAGGAEWFWSAESYVKGYHTVVDTVSAKPETIYATVPRKKSACGAVHPVRP